MIKKGVRLVLNHIPRKQLQRVVHFIMPVIGIFYWGRKVECPVCGGSYSKFMPYGYAAPRENALCPGCLALERHRLMWLYLLSETDFFKNSPELLHIAPERCFIKRFRKILGNKYITADLESPLADVKMDIQDIPFEDDHFEAVFCNHIMEHVEDDRLAMREIYRVMQPGGWGIIMSPVTYSLEKTYEDPAIVSPGERLKAFGQPDHLREYGRDYPMRLSQAGFQVECVDYLKKLPEDKVRLYGLRSEIIYVVRKPIDPLKKS